MLGLLLPTALVAVAEGGGLIALPYDLYVVDAALPGLFRLHMLTGGLALALLPLTLVMRGSPSWHRPLGRLTATAVLLAGVTAIPSGLVSPSVAFARAGFLAQAVTWLAFLALGIRAIRKRDRHTHATAMLAMTAVAAGAVAVRLATVCAVAWRWPFDPVYGAVAWLGWLVPLALVLHLRSSRRLLPA